MTNPTFNRLKNPKKAAIERALLLEFSSYPLSEATVSRIVEEAGISRGAFYVYFSDLKDAYLYICREIIRRVHLSNPGNLEDGTPEKYIEAVKAFVGSTEAEGYMKFFARAFVDNAKVTKEIWREEAANPITWAVSLLCHETIRSIYKGSDAKECIERLRFALSKLLA
ncbi:MAG: TetR/AcrR family transcriptional regulator [Aeriscardovia sp.]|nr:TetR/AcrR family transcriptional regulator [Aeriscardovia sp.]